MWLFVIIYVIYLVLEAISEIAKVKKKGEDATDSFLPTVLGFSFAASSVNSELSGSENISRILFLYAIVYTIYWISTKSIKMYCKKR